MNKSLRVRLGTDEDLEGDFGSERLLIGVPVRPPVEETEQPQDDDPE